MTDRVSMIVGGSSGIGRAAAAHLAKDGRTVIIVGRDPDKLAASRRELEKETSGRIEIVAADLYDPTAVARRP